MMKKLRTFKRRELQKIGKNFRHTILERKVGGVVGTCNKKPHTKRNPLPYHKSTHLQPI